MKRGGRTRGVPVMRRLNRWAWAEILAALLLLAAALASWWMTERRETEAEISYLLSVYGEQMESRLSGMDRTMPGDPGIRRGTLHLFSEFQSIRPRRRRRSVSSMKRTAVPAFLPPRRAFAQPLKYLPERKRNHGLL